VLTLEELTGFVRTYAPAREKKSAAQESPIKDRLASSLDLPAKLRHLLARRLMRAGRYLEAAEFFPAALQSLCLQFRNGLDTQANAAIDLKERAKALFSSASIYRKYGLELFGAELEPDWHITFGEFEAYGVTAAHRAMALTNAVSLVTSNEVARAATHGCQPELRWHYRYKAADMAWEAAKLLPDNDDLTAEILCTAGSWIKNVDPAEADRFYKALVNRCRKTALGAEADRKRWFPALAQANIATESTQGIGN